MRERLSRGVSSHPPGRPLRMTGAVLLHRPRQPIAWPEQSPTKDGADSVSSDQPVEGEAAENAEQKATKNATQKASRRRRWMVGSLIAAASLVLILSVLALWIRRVVLDSDGYNATTTQLLQQPEIQQALATKPGRPALCERRHRHPDPAAPAQAGTAAGRPRRGRAARLRLPRRRAPAGLRPRPAGVDQGEQGRPRAAGAGAGRRREPPEDGGRRGLDQHQRPASRTWPAVWG